MSDSELAVVAPQSFPAPILIERASASTRKKFFEFFTVPIRNARTRAAYYRAIQQFLADAPAVEEVTGSKREPGFIGSDIDKRSVQTGNVIASTPFLGLELWKVPLQSRRHQNH
jgi:hypothetical protein